MTHSLRSGFILACSLLCAHLAYGQQHGAMAWGRNGIPARQAQFALPTDVAVDGAGNLYVADSYTHTILQIATSELAATLAGLTQFRQTVRPSIPSQSAPGGLVYALAGLEWESGSADGTGSNARFNRPSGVTVDRAGNLYVADSGNHTIRKITSRGVVTTLAGWKDVLSNVSYDVNANSFTRLDP